MTAHFVRVDDGRVEAILSPDEAKLLTDLSAQLRELVTLDEGSVRDRLFPRAYLDPTEQAAEEEWQRLMHADLLAGKLAAVEVFAESLSRARSGRRDVRVALDDEETAAWLGALNDARLALGVLLEVTEDLDLETLDPDDPRTPGLHLYGWLTWLQGELVDALNP